MRSALLNKVAATGYPNEVEVLHNGGDRLFEVDSLRKPGSRMLVALPEDGSMGSVDYPVYDPEKGKVKFQHPDAFGKKFKSEVKKYMEAEEEKAQTPKEQEEAINDPSLRKAASTGLECEFIEWEPGQWYYILENWDSPKGAWDWREYAFAYGPFPSEDAANEHLHNNHANPGGASYVSYDPKYHKDPVLQKLIADAPKHTQRRSRWGSRTAGGVKRMWEDEMIQRERDAATVHDLRPIMEELRNLKNKGIAGVLDSFAPVERLIHIAKSVGATALLDRARYYREVLDRAHKYQFPTAPAMPRQELAPRITRSLDRVWKQLESAYVHFVR